MTDVDRLLANHLRNNHGIVSITEMRGLGLSKKQIQLRTTNGTLERVHPGIYRSTTVPFTELSRWRAATSWGGADSRLFGCSAGAALGLDGISDGEKVEIAVTGGTGTEGIRIHRLRPGDLPPTVRVEGIPVTNPTRTIFDLAGRVNPRAVGLALDDALRKRLTAIPRLWDELRRNGGRGRRGAKELRVLLMARDSSDAELRSAFEARMKRILSRIKETKAIPNFRIVVGNDVYYLDFYYPSHLLAIECHSLKWHAANGWLKRDVRRHRALMKAGITVLYFTWEEVFFEPERVEREIRQALERQLLLDIPR